MAVALHGLQGSNDQTRALGEEVNGGRGCCGRNIPEATR